MSDRSPDNIKDVRDLYVLKGPEALWNAPVRVWSPPTTTVPSQNDAPAPPPSSGKKQFTCIHWNDAPFSLDSADLIHGLLLHGDVSVVYGPPNIGKSYWTLDLAAHIASNVPYRGKMRVEGGPVIYITLEGQRTFTNRLDALKKHKSLHAQAPLYYFNAPFSLLTEEDTESLVECIIKLSAQIGTPARLIVIDTLSRAMAGGDESSSVDMGKAIQAATTIKTITGAHVMLVHHTGKDEARGARGHSSLRGAVDTEIEINKNKDSCVTFAHVKKQRDLGTIPPMAFTLKTVVLGLNNYGEKVTSCIVVHNHDAPAVYSAKSKSNRTKPVPTSEQILALVPETGHIQKIILKQTILDKLGAADRVANVALTEMLQGGQLREWRVKSSTGQSTLCITRP